MSSDSEQVVAVESSSPGYPRRLLENMTRLWRENSFCDVTLLIGKRRFQAHKHVLAACSPFFKAMFLSGMEEQSSSEIELHDISSDIFHTVISFIYTGRVIVDINTCQDLLSVADMLRVDDIVDICSQFLLEHMTPQNCVGVYVFADGHNLVSMKQQAELYLEKNFIEVCKGEEFLQLDIDALLPILASERLHIERESQVLEAGIEWITFDLPLRRKYLLQILSCIRMNLISQRHLFQVIDSCTDHGIKITLTKYASLSATPKLLNPHDMYLPASNVSTPSWPRHNAKKYIYIVGGYARNRHTFISNISTLDTVERFDVYTKKWQSFASMCNARSSHGLTTLDRKIVVAGGEDASLISNLVETFDPDENCWTPLPSMIHPRYGLGLVSLSGYMYAIGGYVGTEVGASVERFDPRERLWVEIDTMPNPRFSMAVVEYEGLIYVVGGLTGLFTESDCVESYNPVTKEWCELAQLKKPRAYHGLVAHDGYLYAVGGFNEFKGSLKSVEKFSIKDDKWTVVSPMHIGRAGAGVALLDSKIYVFGGRSQDVELSGVTMLNSSTTLGSAECYDPDKDVWCSLPNMTHERCETVAVVL